MGINYIQKPTNRNDYDNYVKLLLKTNALHHDYDPNNPNPRSSRSDKWKKILGPIWKRYKKKEEYEERKSMRERDLLLFRAILMHW